MQQIKRIVIIGPESTGKSTLCNLLAAHYNTIWCAEYAREYLLNNGTDYTYDDLLTIAKGQLLLQDETEKKIKPTQLLIDNGVFPNNTVPLLSHTPELLFIDTDMYVMKVWCEYVFSNCHQFILEEIINRKYDLYLLCKPDIPWIADELREYPDEQIRLELYHIYRDILINQHVPWAEVSGDYQERLRLGAEAVDRVLSIK